LVKLQEPELFSSYRYVRAVSLTY